MFSNLSQGTGKQREEMDSVRGVLGGSPANVGKELPPQA